MFCHWDPRATSANQTLSADGEDEAAQIVHGLTRLPHGARWLRYLADDLFVHGLGASATSPASGPASGAGSDAAGATGGATAGASAGATAGATAGANEAALP